ncbi:hypothetical protein PENTCL1PPCAC_7621, partial [Pristionchus entomophagus]
SRCDSISSLSPCCCCHCSSCVGGTSEELLLEGIGEEHGMNEEILRRVHLRDIFLRIFDREGNGCYDDAK